MLCCAILILSCMQEHFHLAEDVSLESTNIAFDKAVQKVIKDAIKHTRLVSTALYYSQVLYHLLYLMTKFLSYNNICCTTRRC
jgi:hypothetical protein